MKITQLRHAYPEFAGFCIDRRNGHEDYTFLHFFGPMTVLTRDGYVKTPPNACIIYAPAEPQFFRSDEKVIHDWIHFSGDDAKDVLEKLGIETDVLYYPQRTEFITDLTRNLEREFFSDKTGANAYARNKIRRTSDTVRARDRRRNESRRSRNESQVFGVAPDRVLVARKRVDGCRYGERSRFERIAILYGIPDGIRNESRVRPYRGADERG